MTETMLDNAKQERIEIVEEFLKERAKKFSLEDAKRICLAYEKYIIGTHDFYEMGLVHAGEKKAKEDYAHFYNSIKDILKPTSEELELLVSEGFEGSGLISLIDENVLNPYTQRIVVSMIANK